MNDSTFNQIIEEQIKLCTDMLLKKAGEYAEDNDRLHNFRVAASLQGIDEADALGGMMSKHTVSIYDMVGQGDPTEFTIEQWNEKITDHINYLLLLKAIVMEAINKGKTPTFDVNSIYPSNFLSDPIDLATVRGKILAGSPKEDLQENYDPSMDFTEYQGDVKQVDRGYTEQYSDTVEYYDDLETVEDYLNLHWENVFPSNLADIRLVVSWRKDRDFVNTYATHEQLVEAAEACIIYTKQVLFRKNVQEALARLAEYVRHQNQCEINLASEDDAVAKAEKMIEVAGEPSFKLDFAVIAESFSEAIRKGLEGFNLEVGPKNENRAQHVAFCAHCQQELLEDVSILDDWVESLSEKFMKKHYDGLSQLNKFLFAIRQNSNGRRNPDDGVDQYEAVIAVGEWFDNLKAKHKTETLENAVANVLSYFVK